MGTGMAGSWRGVVSYNTDTNALGFEPQHPRTVAWAWQKDDSWAPPWALPLVRAFL